MFQRGHSAPCCASFTFYNQDLMVAFFFFYIKDGHTFGNAQNVRACQSIFRLGVYMHLGALEG